jgi:hypothetical protein
MSSWFPTLKRFAQFLKMGGIGQFSEQSADFVQNMQSILHATFAKACNSYQAMQVKCNYDCKGSGIAPQSVEGLWRFDHSRNVPFASPEST